MTTRSTTATRRILLRQIATLAMSIACTSALGADPATLLSEGLTVVGAVARPVVLAPDDLKAFPSDQIATLTLPRSAEARESGSTIRGVRLTAVLERAGLQESDHNTWKHTVVLATATDGYQVVFSWPELFNTEVGTGVLVVFERDGAPLGDREGRIALVSGRDTRTGPRNVHWLTRIDVRVLAP